MPNICRTCERYENRAKSCYFERNNLVCKVILEAHKEKRARTIAIADQIIRELRQNVFGPNGDYSSELIRKIKNSKPYQAHMREREDEARIRAGERLERMGY